MQKNASSKKQQEAAVVDGKTFANDILHNLKKKIVSANISLGLAAILIGDNPSSHLYVRNKERACHKVGIEFHKYLCNSQCFKNITEDGIIEMIHFLNQDPAITGILVQLPLPQNFHTERIIRAIDPKKDADGFHPENIKKILSGKTELLPPLVKTILFILQSQNADIAEKTIVIASRNDMLTRVIASVLQKENPAQILRTDPESRDYRSTLRSADILISILGKPQSIHGDMLKPGVGIIDVGITKTEAGFRGDVDFPSIKKVASFATPTPGGVGPLTVAMLLCSVFQLAKQQKAILPPA